MQNNWFAVAQTQLSLGPGSLALQTLRAGLARSPDHVAGWCLFAVAAIEAGAPREALHAAERAIALGARDARMRIVRARALLAIGRHDAARDAAERLAADATLTPLEADSVGVLLVRTGRHAAALPLFECACRAEPGRGQFWYNLATARHFTGDGAGAETAYRSALRADPRHDRARLALADLGPAEPAALDALAGRFAEVADAPDHALLVGHAAARIAERMGDDAAALAWLDRAKAGMAARRPYDPAETRALFVAALAAARRAIAAAARPAVDERPAPLFVVGMPRSGTTLTDRIISAHPRAASLGELPDLSVLVKRAAGTPGARVLDAATLAARIDAAALGAAYRARIAPLAGDAAVVVDKMPFNLFLAGHVLTALPAARVLMVRRDPVDLAFANYRQLFATGFGYYDYAYDLAATAHWIGWFDAFADRIAAMLGGPRLTELRYERLVTAPAAETRRIVDFAGLDWDAACLRPQDNRAPVATPSAAQVRRPISAEAVGRGRRHGARADMVAQVHDRALAEARVVLAAV